LNLTIWHICVQTLIPVFVSFRQAMPQLNQ